MGRIIEASDLPIEDKLYLKKDLFGWRVVNPIRNTDGSINHVNLFFGGARNFAFLLIMLAFVLGFFYVYNHDTSEMQGVLENPCGYCGTIDMQKVMNERLIAFEKVNKELDNDIDFSLINNLTPVK